MTDSDGLVRFSFGAHRGCQALLEACEWLSWSAELPKGAEELLGPASEGLFCLVKEGLRRRKRPLLVRVSRAGGSDAIARWDGPLADEAVELPGYDGH